MTIEQVLRRAILLDLQEVGKSVIVLSDSGYGLNYCVYPCGKLWVNYSLQNITAQGSCLAEAG